MKSFLIEELSTCIIKRKRKIIIISITQCCPRYISRMCLSTTNIVVLLHHLYCHHSSIFTETLIVIVSFCYRNVQR